MQNRYTGRRMRLAQLFAATSLILTIAAPNSPWHRAAWAAENKSTSLTTSERELGKRLGVSEEALSLIKTALKPEKATVKMGGLEDPDDSFVEVRGTQQPLLPEDRRQYLKIAAAYPELKAIVKPPLQIDSGQFSEPEIKDVNREVFLER